MAYAATAEKPKFSLDELVQMPRFNVLEATGLSGLYDGVKDYYVNFYKSVMKGETFGRKVGNYAKFWVSALGSYELYSPVKELLQYGIANVTGTAVSGSSLGTLEGAIAGHSIVGGSSAGTFLTSVAPYVPFTAAGIYAMYKGFEKRSPVLIGIGSAMAFSPLTYISDFYLGAKSLLKLFGLPASGVSLFGVTAALVGIAYSVSKRIVRRLTPKKKES
ncbi:MAG: hypothetical protein GXP63_01910 [DPANN group archaeon]|nr:hypothetical protein [DPANN group archaeon]